MTAPGGRRLAAVAIASVLATGLLAASAGTVGANERATGTGGGALDAHGSVEEVYVLDAPPGVQARLERSGDVVAKKKVDDEGSVLFENVKPGAGYTVVAGSGKGSTSQPVRVLAPDDHPDQSFYDGQTLEPGLNYLETRDGTTLAATVRLPGPIEDGPYPTVIEYSGYDPANPDDPEPSTLIGGVLGYATVGVNLRGTGCSGGAFDAFEQLQALDGYDVVETVAAQPWVEFGKVGMVGISYPGIMQLYIAGTQPPHLAAISPLSVIDDIYRATLYPGGILNTGFASTWAAERQADAEPGGQPWAQKRIDEGDETCIANQALRGQNHELADDIEANEFYTPGKRADAITPYQFVDRIDVPVFLAGAWQDEQTGGHFPDMLNRFTSAPIVRFTMTNGTHSDSLGPALITRLGEFLDLYVARAHSRGTRRGAQPRARPLRQPHGRGRRRAAARPLPRHELRGGEAGVRAGAGGADPVRERRRPAGRAHRSRCSRPASRSGPRRRRRPRPGTSGPTARSPTASRPRRTAPTATSPTRAAGPRPASRASRSRRRGPRNRRTRGSRSRTAPRSSYLSEPLTADTAMVGTGSVDLWVQSTAKDADLAGDAHRGPAGRQGGLRPERPPARQPPRHRS